MRSKPAAEAKTRPPRWQTGKVPPEVMEKFIAMQAAEAHRQDRFGKVRPIIHTDFHEHKLVAVGSTIHWSKGWKTFPDFLFDNIKTVLGVDWGTAELKKSLAERHVVLQWYDALCRFQAAHPHGPEGIAEGVPDGPSMAYLSLAYDLYVLADHLVLQERLVARLKHPDQFQGARYELAVAATMIRAGFDLEHEDETDSTRPHTEFIATHRETGQKLAIEAKSRHRPGVLGQKGQLKTREEFRMGIRGLLRDAIAKAPALPYVIFIDANMPPEIALEEQERWLGEVQEAVVLSDPALRNAAFYKGSGFNMLAVTNFPHHYGRRGEPDPGKHVLVIIPDRPQRSVNAVSVVEEIEQAIRQYGTIPQSFEDESPPP
jgi:hypothetical protein